MSIRQAVLQVACVVILAGHAYSAELALGRGHLAARVDDGEWASLQLGDPIPNISQLRTSPTGPIRIDLEKTELSIAGDSSIKLNVSEKRIELESGRVLVRITGPDTKWTIVAGAMTFTCDEGSEVEISFADTLGVNVLRESVQVAGPKQDGTILKSPLEWIADEQGNFNSEIPKADDWAPRIRQRTVPKAEQGLGQLVTKETATTKSTRLEVAQYHVNVTLKAPLALVQIDQSFYNPDFRQEEGTYVFNLPEGASVSRFAMYVNADQLIEGELIEREQADAVYSSIVRQKRDPAILEQIGRNLFRMRIFPIFARDTKRILLDYTVPLLADNGRYHFELPLMSDLKPIWDFELTGTISPPFAAKSVVSPSFPKISFSEEKNGELSFSLNERDFRPPARFSIDYRAPDQLKPYVRTFLNGTQQYFAATLPATANPLKRDLKPLPADVLVVVDTSRTAVDLKLARLAASTIVRNLRQEDRCQIGCVDLQFRALTKDWLAPRSIESQHSLRQLEEIVPLGAGKLDAAVLESLALFDEVPAGRRRVIVYVGDGTATMISDRRCWDDRRLQFDATPRVEFHGIIVSDGRSDSNWLRSCVERCRGRLFTVHKGTYPSRDIFEWALSGLPAVSNVVDCLCSKTDSADLFYDFDWPVGREFHIYGKCPVQNSLELQMRISGQVDQVFQLDVSQTTKGDPFVGRQWAARKLESLLLGDNLKKPRSDSAIVQLCQEWSLMSPFTAFLVLESERDYEQWHITRSARQRYWPQFSRTEGVRVHNELMKLALAHGQRVSGVLAPTNDATFQLPSLRVDQIKHRLDFAKQALVNKNPSAALWYLTTLYIADRSVDLPRYNSLIEEARSEMRKATALKELKIWASLVDRTEGDSLPPVSPLFLGLAACGMNKEYAARHPHTDKLLKPAPDLQNADGEVDVVAMGEALKKVTGLPVLIDVKAMADEGIPIETLLKVGLPQGLSMRSVADFNLSDSLLRLVPERHLIRITTMTAAEERMVTHIYPIEDFLDRNKMPLPERLANPVLDEDYRARVKIESQLKQPISVNMKDVPLGDAIEFVTKDIPHLVDLKAMSDEGIGIDAPVTLVLDNLPREIVLQELLAPRLLDYVIKGGAAVFTTKTTADVTMETRLYSAAGIIDENQPDPLTSFSNPYRNFQYPGAGWGGFGAMGGISSGFGGIGGGMGGMGGGMGGGMMGGMGGGMMGGMGGGMMGGAGGGNAANAKTDQISRISAPDIDDFEDAEQTPTSSTDNERFPRLVNLGILDVPSRDLNSGIRFMEQSTSGKWEDADGEGGSINYDPLSFSFVVRQSRRVHAELQELCDQTRKLAAANRRAGQFGVPANQKDLQTGLLFGQLIRILKQGFDSIWFDQDGEGGIIASQYLTSSLVIRQHEQAHEEIDRLLAQLRRARYVAQSLPWLTSLDGIDDLAASLDRPTMANLPQNLAEIPPDNPAHSQKLRLLSVRKLPGSLNQRWRNVSAIAKQPRELAIRRHGQRLEFEFPDRVFRAEGPRAAIAYPGLTLVELDLWGDASRQIADATFPWLPHRTNAEIARLFDVVQEAEDANEVTLKLILPGSLDTYLRATFARQSGQPIRWKTFVAGHAAFELRFEPKQVVAVDAAGQELERWELLSDEPDKPIAALESNWGDNFLVEPSKAGSPLVKVRQAIREGKLAAAKTQLENLLKDFPKQPLLNFLYAWCLRLPDAKNPDQMRQQQTALQRVAMAGSQDLVPLLTSGNFPAFDDQQLRQMLLSVPENQRSEEVWDRLAVLAMGQSEFEVALSLIDQTIAKTTYSSRMFERLLKKINLLLLMGRPNEADQLARSLVSQNLSASNLLKLADQFADSNQIEMSNFYYDRYRTTPGLSRRDQIHATLQQGNRQRRNELRWEAMFNSVLEFGEDQRLIDMIVSEASTAEDALMIERLAAKLPRSEMQLRLLRRQLEIDTPPRQADLALRLLKEKRLRESDINILIAILAADNRNQEIIEILEKHLRRGERLDVSLISLLKTSYQAVGRTMDFQRAESEERLAPAL